MGCNLMFAFKEILYFTITLPIPPPLPPDIIFYSKAILTLFNFQGWIKRKLVYACTSYSLLLVTPHCFSSVNCDKVLSFTPKLSIAFEVPG